MDTLEGIAEWWLERQHISIETRMLAKVLDQLTERGILEEVSSGDSKRYRLTRRQGLPR